MGGNAAVTRIEALPARSVRTAAAVVGVAQTALVAWLISTSSYFRDDYPFLAMARHGGFAESQLTTSVFGSLVPGFQLGNSLLASLQPIPRWPAVVLPTLLYAVALLLLYRLGELLFGPRPVLVAFMVIAGLSGVLAISLVWWTAGLNSLPAVVADLLALDGLVRARVTGRRRHLVVSAVAFAVGVSFYDASSSFLVVLVLCSALYLTGPSAGWRDVLASFRRQWPLWAAYVAPIAANFAWRQAHGSEYALPPLPSVGAGLRFVGAGWAQGFIPSMVGANYAGLTQSATRAVIVVAGQGLILGLAAYSIVRRRQAWKAWALFGGGFLALELVAAIGRGYAGTTFALNTVYWVVQPFVLMLAVGLAFLPVRPECQSGPVALAAAPAPAPAKQPAKSAKSAKSAKVVVTVGRWTTLGFSLVTAATVLAAGLGIRALWTAPDREQGALNRQYVDNISASWRSIHAGQPDAFVWDTLVPPYVLTPVFTPYNRIATTAGQVVSLRIDAASGHGYVAEDSGQLVPAVTSVVSQMRARQPQCFARRPVSRAETVPLGNAVPVGNWFLWLQYRQASGFTGSIGGDHVRFKAGAGAILIPDAAVAVSHDVSIVVPAGASGCVTAAAIEQPVAR